MADEICNVKGCNEVAERSINIKKVEPTGMDIEEGCRQVHLCKAHYKGWKKLSKDAIPDYLGN